MSEPVKLLSRNEIEVWCNRFRVAWSIADRGGKDHDFEVIDQLRLTALAAHDERERAERQEEHQAAARQNYVNLVEEFARYHEVSTAERNALRAEVEQLRAIDGMGQAIHEIAAREDRLAALRVEVERMRTRPCSVCAGTGIPVSGPPCICDGVGTEDAEMVGLRRECFALRAEVERLERVREALVVTLAEVTDDRDRLQGEALARAEREG